MIKKVLKKLILVNNKFIAFESLNDFDCNSGALYNYIIKNGINRRYKIIWLVKNYEKYKTLKIKNVKVIDFYNRNIFDKILLYRAKYLIWDNVPIEKSNEKQISIYLTHGFPPIKNVRGIINIPENCDYFLISSKKFEQLAIEQFSIKENTKFIYGGYPRNDYLMVKNDELNKITKTQYNKVIIWMPTFRKAKNVDRNDSSKNFKFGIPLIENNKQYSNLNKLLAKNNNLLIIKIHSGQDQNVITLNEQSNIKIMTSETEKKIEINLYKLLANTDALLTDYSSVAFDYLLVNKPIGYIIDDIKEYKLGFAYDNVFDMMPGEKIKEFDDLINFINNVNDNEDEFKKSRNKILNNINDFQDGNNCRRLLDMFNIK